MSLNRREFLGGAVGALLTACGIRNEKEPSPSTRRKEDRERHVSKKYEKHDTGMDLNALHARVANAFNQEVGDELKRAKNLCARHFSIRLERRHTGEYFLSLSVELISADHGKKSERNFESRSTVWAGRNAKQKVDEHYQKSIVPWKDDMRGRYAIFHTEELRGGDDDLAFRACMMTGREK